jgi:oligoendopeptidase F
MNQFVRIGGFMNRLFNILILLIALFIFSQTQVFSQTRERAEVPVEDTWKLEDLYTSDEAWNKAKQKWAAQFDNILKYKGKLANSASELLACLEFNSDISKEFGRLQSYAAMKSDQDMRDSKYLAMKQELQQLVTDYSSKASFIEP